MPPASPTVKYEIKDRVAWVTLNRPRVMNAMNNDLRNAMSKAFMEATNDKNVLVIVVTGEGGKAFSTGADLKAGRDRDDRHHNRTERMNHVDHVEQCPKPVIAAVDGYCLGGGMELALRCDIRIATEQSLFGLPEPRSLGIFAPYGLQHLPRNIPLGEALWILLTGAHMTAQRAYEIGLIQALVPDRDALFAEAEHIANEIKLCVPSVVQAIKRIVRAGHNLTVQDTWKLAEPIMRQLDNMEDRREARRAFFEKRPPVWKMRQD